MLKNFDWPLLVWTIFIFLLGGLVLYSVAPNFFSHQLLYFVLGLILFFLFSNLDYRIFENLSIPLYFFSLIFLFSPFLLGKITRGASRWISIGSFTLQPSELVKPVLILIFASWACHQNLSQIKNLCLLFLLFLPLALLIFYQPALGSTLVILTVFLAIIFSAGLKMSHLVSGLIIGTVFFPLFWKKLASYQKKRLLAFLNPQKDPLGSGYHLIQSKIAIGSGGIFGKGLGQGTQTHLKFLPEFQSDFIFAALAEELGLVGCLFLLGFYLFLLCRILKIGQESKDQFGFLIAVGVFTMLFFQLTVNVGMNIGLMPITGITLPLVSSGGSSLVATLISLGLIESIAKVEKKII